MPLPADYGTGHVTGKFVTLGGAAVVGYLTFSLQPDVQALIDPAHDTVIMPAPHVVNLDGSGAFAVDLPATDDTDITPSGWSYIVEETFSNAKGRTYSLSVPVGGSVDISQVVIAAPAPAVTTINWGPSSDHAARVESILAHGADPLGGADSASAVTAALAQSDNGGTAYLPEGVFRCDTDVNYPTPNTTTFQPSPRLQGAGPNLTIVIMSPDAKINVTAPTIEGTGAFTAGTQAFIEIDGITFLGGGGGTCLFLQRYFKLNVSNCRFDKQPAAAYSFDKCIESVRSFQTTPTRHDDLQVQAVFDNCLFMYFNVGYDDLAESAPANTAFNNCYFQGLTPSATAAQQLLNPDFLSHGVRTCSNSLGGVGTSFVSVDVGLYLDQGGDPDQADVLPKAFHLDRWHFEGNRYADIHIERCVGMLLTAPFFIERHGADASRIPYSIYIAENGSSQCHDVTIEGGAVFPSQDATYGPNWRMIFAGDALRPDSAVRVQTVNSLMLGEFVDADATRFNRVVIEQGNHKIGVGQNVNVDGYRAPDDTADRFALRPNGPWWADGTSAADTGLHRTSGLNVPGVLNVINPNGDQFGSLLKPSLIDTNLLDVTHWINTWGKVTGREVWDATTGLLVVASGAGASDPWLWVLTGETAYMPGGSSSPPVLPVTKGGTGADNAADARANLGVPSTGDLTAETVRAEAAEALLIPLAQKGANSGVATLDSSGHLPAAQLPIDAFEYQGNWNASTNTPTLANGTGSAGDVYYVNVAGTNLGATFKVSDRIVYNGSTWQKWQATDPTDIAGNAATATALQTPRNIDGQPFDGTANVTVVAPGTHAATSKGTPADADEIPLVDSAASNVLKRLTWANLKATLKTYFDGLYPSGSGTSTGTNTGDQTLPTLGSLGADAVLVPTAVKTANYSASANDLVPCDTTSAGFTVMLPSAPADKTRLAVKHVIQGGANTVTVACGGSDVFNKASGSTSLTLSLLAQAVLLQYKASSGIWYIVADDLPLAQLDSRYATPASVATKMTDPSGNVAFAGVTIPARALDRIRGQVIPRTAVLYTTMDASTTALVVFAPIAGETDLTRTGVAEVVRIDNEQMLVTAASAGTAASGLTVTLAVVRGVNGTTAAAHTGGSGVPGAGALVTTSAVVHIAWCGDSVVQTVADNVRSDLDRRLGGSLGLGFRGIWKGQEVGAAAPGFEWAYDGSAPTSVTGANDVGPWTSKQFAAGTTNGATWARPPQCHVAQLDMYWVDRAAGTGNWSYSTDGGSTWVDNPNYPGSRPSVATLMKSTVVVNDPATFKVRAANAAGTTAVQIFCGVDVWSTKEEFGVTTGIKIHELSWAGQYLSVFADTGSGDWGRIMDGDAASLVPTLVMAGTFSNDVQPLSGSYDSSAYRTNLTTISTRVSPYADVVFIACFEQDRSTYTADEVTCRADMHTVAASTSHAIIDLYDAFSAEGYVGYTAANAAGLMVNTAHPSELGQRDIAARISRVLTTF